MMKKLISFVAVVLVAAPAFAADGDARGRRAMANQMIAAPRVSAVNQINTVSASASMASIHRHPELPHDNNDADNTPSEPEKPAVDNREKEKAACLNNNIGVGNTFVWASRYSNTSSYASMIEDVEHPENNTCFVKVEIRSDDSRIQVSDIPAKYFEWGTNITCGSWADEEKLRKRILDAKKSARTWGTVAGAVGGAAVGVGIMELFGNRLIGGAVQGQKSLSGDALLRSQLLALRKESGSDYDEFVRQVKILKAQCEDDIWKDAAESELPEGCTFDFDTFIRVANNVN